LPDRRQDFNSPVFKKRHRRFHYGQMLTIQKYHRLEICGIFLF
jgi:hypothetical protein